MEWTPLHVGHTRHWHMDAGLAARIATGYTTREVAVQPGAAAAVIRFTAPDGTSINFLSVPNMPHRDSGFIGLQIGVPME